MRRAQCQGPRLLSVSTWASWQGSIPNVHSLGTQPIYPAIHTYIMYQPPSHSLHAKRMVRGTTEWPGYQHKPSKEPKLSFEHRGDGSMAFLCAALLQPASVTVIPNPMPYNSSPQIKGLWSFPSQRAGHGGMVQEGDSKAGSIPETGGGVAPGPPSPSACPGAAVLGGKR